MSFISPLTWGLEHVLKKSIKQNLNVSVIGGSDGKKASHFKIVWSKIQKNGSHNVIF
jgi:hypothetical protein